MSEINTYKVYLAFEKAISIERMDKIHKVMIAEIGDDSDALDMYEEFVNADVRYAAFRAECSNDNRQQDRQGQVPDFPIQHDYH